MSDSPRKHRRDQQRRELGHREEVRAQIEEWLEITDLAAAMQEEDTPPEMLVPDWFQKGVLHWAQGEPEDGKSWVMLWCAVLLLRADPDATVLLMDGEMGTRTVAARLNALGLSPDMADERVTHVNLSVLPRDAFDAFSEWARVYGFTLIIWDPIAHHLAGADYDENSNRDVQEWIAKVVNPLLREGATVVGIDHITKGGASNGYARGASAKKARPRVVYAFDKKEGFDRESVGKTIVSLVKNSDSALIPKEREVHLGGTPANGRFMVRVVERDAEVVTDRRQDDRRRWVQRAVTLLESADGGELSETVLAKQISGKEAKVKEALRESANSAGGPLDMRVEQRGERSFTFYSRRTDGGARLG